MLQEIKDLPPGVVGVEAHGKVVKSDYQKVLVPLLDDEILKAQKIKLLFRVSPDFDGFSAGAAWEDLRLGVRFRSRFDRCAIVTDVKWIKRSTNFARFLMPCPVKTFGDANVKGAVAWLSAADATRSVEAELLADSGILVLEPRGPLGPEDFDYVASLVDPWIEQHGHLNGIVVQAKKFPGWENINGLIQHIRFVRGHHRLVRRIAVLTDGLIMEFLPRLGARLIDAEVKVFGHDELGAALAWIETADVKLPSAG